jgi:type IV pilus assembly protein PilC
MPLYAFTARDSSGTPVDGTLHASSAEQAAQQLRAQGRFATSVRPVSEKARAAGGGGIKIRRDEVIGFSNQLAVMLDTGVTLAEALECCSENASRPQVKELLEDLSSQVQNGIDFSAALARHPRSFPKLYIALIQASEKSGMMSRLLTRATQYLKDEQEILRKVKGALTYPGIMFGFALLTTVFLLAFVMPRFTVIYANKGAALPAPTKILMTLSDALVTQWMYIVPAVGAAVVCLAVFLRSARGKVCKDWASLKVPLVGPMLQKLHLARGLRTIGTMASAGVALTDCVDTARALSGNSYFAALWNNVSEKIQNGRPFSEPLRASPLVPGSVSRMLASGEKGGKLAMVMEQVASFAEIELKEKIHELTRYIEPAMIMMMGLLIGGVALALLMPIFSISNVVAH